MRNQGISALKFRKLKKLREAWENPGKTPAYHEAMKRKLRREWSVLYYALESLFHSPEQFAGNEYDAIIIEEAVYPNNNEESSSD